MPITSIRLVFSNQAVAAARISEVLRMQPSQRYVESDNANNRRGFPFWELDDEEAQDVETLLPLWVSVLEAVHVH